MIAGLAPVRVLRALEAASIACPDTDCGMYCRCVSFQPGELAVFECRACQRRYHVRLSAALVLRSEAVEAPAGAA